MYKRVIVIEVKDLFGKYQDPYRKDFTFLTPIRQLFDIDLFISILKGI